MITILAETNIDNIIKDNPDVNNFYFTDGNYYLTKNLNINKPNINFIGLSKNPKMFIFFN